MWITVIWMTETIWIFRRFLKNKQTNKNHYPHQRLLKIWLPRDKVLTCIIPGFTGLVRSRWFTKGVKKKVATVAAVRKLFWVTKTQGKDFLPLSKLAIKQQMKFRFNKCKITHRTAFLILQQHIQWCITEITVMQEGKAGFHRPFYERIICTPQQ